MDHFSRRLFVWPVAGSRCVFSIRLCDFERGGGWWWSCRFPTSMTARCALLPPIAPIGVSSSIHRTNELELLLNEVLAADDWTQPSSTLVLSVCLPLSVSPFNVAKWGATTGLNSFFFFICRPSTAQAANPLQSPPGAAARRRWRLALASRADRQRLQPGAVPARSSY